MEKKQKILDPNQGFKDDLKMLRDSVSFFPEKFDKAFVERVLKLELKIESNRDELRFLRMARAVRSIERLKKQSSSQAEKINDPHFILEMECSPLQGTINDDIKYQTYFYGVRWGTPSFLVLRDQGGVGFRFSKLNRGQYILEVGFLTLPGLKDDPINIDLFALPTSVFAETQQPVKTKTKKHTVGFLDGIDMIWNMTQLRDDFVFFLIQNNHGEDIAFTHVIMFAAYDNF